MRGLAAAWMLALLANAGTAGAADEEHGEVRIFSARPDSVSVTIYRDLFALVTETRTVDLPAGAVSLRIEGVLDSMLPQSAVINGTGRAALESNHDFNPLNPRSLLIKSVGKTVTVSRTNPATGRATDMSATVISVSDDRGVILRSQDGVDVLQCSGLPERLVFDEVPGELQARPTLSVKLAAGEAGRRVVQVSYIATGFGWDANYLARLDNPASMQLAGWISLHNFTDSSFAGARVQLVAGRLNLIDVDDGGSSPVYYSAEHATPEEVENARAEKLRELREARVLDERAAIQDSRSFAVSRCFPLGKTTDGLPQERLVRREASAMVDSISADASADLAEIIVVRQRHEAERESLADYQLYRLPWATDLNAHQSKQVAFLHKDAVTIERFYRVRLDTDLFDSSDEATRFQPDVMVGWRNEQATGLGEPLPAGRLRVFERADGRDIFVGEARLFDSAVGMPVEAAIGRASNLVVRLNPVPEPGGGALAWAFLTRRLSLDMDLDIQNDKPGPVTVEIRQQENPWMASQRVSSPTPYERKYGDFSWRLQVPANSTGELRYKLKGKIERDAL